MAACLCMIVEVTIALYLVAYNSGVVYAIIHVST